MADTKNSNTFPFHILVECCIDVWFPGPGHATLSIKKMFNIHTYTNSLYLIPTHSNCLSLFRCHNRFAVCPLLYLWMTRAIHVQHTLSNTQTHTDRNFCLSAFYEFEYKVENTRTYFCMVAQGKNGKGGA